MQNPINTKVIYLDYAATTPLSPAAGAAIEANLYVPYGNSSSLHQIGRHAHDVLANCRQKLATALIVDPQEIILTGSGTESDNLAILGLARAHRSQGNHIIVSAIEHKAVLVAAKQLESEGFLVTYLPVDARGKISKDDLLAALRVDTILVSIMYANNEIGTIEPIIDLVRTCRKFSSTGYPLVHTDACQAVGILPVEPRKLGVDAMTINSSKIYGPKGIGLLYLRAGVTIKPLILGGDQELSRRAGTENVALTAGFAAALDESVKQTVKQNKILRGLQTYFTNELQIAVPGIIFNGHPVDRLPNNVHVTIPEVEGESMVLMLNDAGICCATGSACSTLDLTPSHVLLAIGQADDLVHGSLRFTFGRNTTKDELHYTARKLGEVVTRLRQITVCTTTAYRRSKNTPSFIYE